MVAGHTRSLNRKKKNYEFIIKFQCDMYKECNTWIARRVLQDMYK